ncbi:MAG: hypothetical protein COV59_02890 [Candidatus Magasanikbacteria bacterium CG11_big_fil_rev_8_21_14_0_20_39_34]|uniref:Glycosyltransferase 2-like domain-containing protein n=1 Tax=Candidatus Magasanikbacteria bacterium CG11_big_fil_rev_8_21_14_0_20_39_34 TaxID=1974653 RepID=A0A2H0N7K1_9BACT|nr:MAG: hypothetical protein COV59_02890 [Candidatus Magasanikbacteria bacterium CG11_big_fil_rev_8_21_14_0_20_39_34]
MVQKENLISVIIPVYNRFEELLLALQSLSQQTYRHFEIILVDDGSQGEIQEVIDKAHGWGISCDPQGNSILLKLIKQKNQGAAIARNVGFQASQGSYVIFWDADILGGANMLEEMSNVLDSRQEIDFVYSNFYFGKKRMPAREFDGHALMKGNYIAIATLLRREIFVGFDESLSRFQDWDLWLTLYENGKKGTWINKYLYRAMVSTNGISSWLPRFAYYYPFCLLPGIHKKVREYKLQKEKIIKKHRLSKS